MASDAEGSSRGKNKNILQILERKASNLLGRGKDDAEKAIDKVKDTEHKAKGIESNAEKAIDKVMDTADKAKGLETHAERAIDIVKDSAEKAKEGIEHIKDHLFHKKHTNHDQPETKKAEEDEKAKADIGETSKLENVAGTLESFVASVQPKKEKVEEEIEAVRAVIQPKKEEDTPQPEKNASVPSTEDKKVSVPPPMTDNVPAPATASVPPATEKEDFWESLGKLLENCCSIFKSKKD